MNTTHRGSVKGRQKRSQRNGVEVGGEQGDAAVAKAREEGDPKGPQPRRLSVRETAASAEEARGFVVVDLEESISSKWWVGGRL